MCMASPLNVHVYSFLDFGFGLESQSRSQHPRTTFPDPLETRYGWFHSRWSVSARMNDLFGDLPPPSSSGDSGKSCHMGNFRTQTKSCMNDPI